MRRACIVIALLSAACQSAPTPGATCAHTSECASPLVCRYSRCRAECEANADCPIGAACLLGADGLGACGLDTDLGCQTGIGRTCASGLVCVSDRCERPCTSASECPPDGQCLPIGDGTRFCFDGRASADAALPDVGPGDAGTDAFVPPPDVGADSAILRAGALDVCIGARSACIIAADRRVYCWGAATLGQLGTGGDCTSPGAGLAAPTTPVVGVSDAEQIACGDDFACARSSSGTVSCWGANDVAQLGRHTSAPCDASAMPATIPATTSFGPTIGETRAIQLRAAGRHACVLDATHDTLACWGANDHVFDATSAATTSETALDVTGPLRAGAWAPTDGLATFSLGRDLICVATDSLGAEYCWGSDNLYAQLGFVGAATTSAQSADITAPSVALSIGDTFACALDPLGVASCWGDARNGRLAQDAANLGPSAPATCGPSGTDPCTAVPQQVAPTSLRFSSLASGGGTTCGALDMRSVGSVLCWGDDTSLQAGVDASVAMGTYVHFGDKETYAPVGGVLAGTDPIAALAVGTTLACAIDTRGVLACWGDPDYDGPMAASAAAITIPLP